MKAHDLHSFDQLVSGWCDGRLTPAELAELEQLLSDHADLRRRHLELTALHGSLAWVCAARDVRAADRLQAMPVRRSRWVVAGVGALTAIAAVILLAFTILHRPPQHPLVDISKTPAARITELNGSAEILSPDAGAVAGVLGQEITFGQTLRISEDNGSGVVEYADGTRLHLSAATTVLFTRWQTGAGEPASKVFLSAGLLRAEVAKQPAGRPMILATPHAEVRVDGNTFTCSVGAEATRMEMEEGHVRMVRQADGKAIDLEAGSYAISTAEAAEELAPRTLLNQVIIPRGNIRLSGPALALSADGQRLATVSQGQLTFWSTRTGQKDFGLPIRKDEVRCLAFSPDGLGVAGGGGPGAGLILWDINQRRELLRDNATFSLRTLTYSPDGHWLAGAVDTPGKPSGVQMWDAASAKELRHISADMASVLALSFSPDRKRLAGGTNDRGVLVWDTASGKELAMLKSTPKRERADLVAFSPDDRWLAGSIVGKGVIRLWDAASLTEKMVFPALGRQFRSLAFSLDGRFLAAGTQDGTLFLWSLESGEELMSQKVDARSIRLLCFSADGKTLTVVTDSGVLQHWGVSAVEPQRDPEDN